jgi:hypothetical protein
VIIAEAKDKLAIKENQLNQLTERKKIVHAQNVDSRTTSPGPRQERPVRKLSPGSGH